MKRVTMAILILALTGCAGGSKVGDEELLKGLEGTAGRLGNERSESPKPKTGKPKKQVAPSPTQTAAPKPTVKTWAISITAEGYEADGFDPYNFAVFQGDIIKVTNTDPATKHSFRDLAEPRLFDSGLLKAGKSWSYKASKVGTFNFEDESRPFRTGRLIVQKKP
jgi:hypothetical protein